MWRIAVSKEESRFMARPNTPRSGRGGRRFKSCHSDQLSHSTNGLRGMIWGTKPPAPIHSQRLPGITHDMEVVHHALDQPRCWNSLADWAIPYISLVRRWFPGVPSMHSNRE
jgi:hypothetical protein